MARLRSRLIRWLAPVALLLVLLLLHPLWLTALGQFLVQAQDPFPAEMVAVLAGDGFGHRIRTAAELVRQGYAPKVLVSGPEGHYGSHECDLAIAYAVKLGYPAEWFLPLPHNGDSTREEAQNIVAELARQRVHKLMVVTSNYHTRRAGSVYRALAPKTELRVVAAPDPDFSPAGWWHSRRGRKIFLLEWQKTVADWLGI